MREAPLISHKFPGKALNFLNSLGFAQLNSYYTRYIVQLHIYLSLSLLERKKRSRAMKRKEEKKSTAGTRGRAAGREKNIFKGLF